MDDGRRVLRSTHLPRNHGFQHIDISPLFGSFLLFVHSLYCCSSPMARTLDVLDGEIREVKGRTFKHLGDLLIEIVDRKLYQDRGFTNVEDYFQSEANLPSARQAFRLISATRFARQLPPCIAQPRSERQVRPLLGRKKDEARLLWTMATLVATERGSPLDGKLVSTVVKEFDDGLLREFIPEACLLLGEAAPKAETAVERRTQTARRSKKRAAEEEVARPPKKTETHDVKDCTLEDAYTRTAQIAEVVGRLKCHVCGDRNPADTPFSTGVPLAILQRESRPELPSQTRAVELTAVLGDVLNELMHLWQMLERATPEDDRHVSDSMALSPQEPCAVYHSSVLPNGSSEDELSVAEALLTMSHSVNDHRH